MRGNEIKFNVRYSNNLDLLNLMNVLTGEEFYVNWHKDISKLFGEQLSDYSKSCVKEAVEIMGSAMLGPYLSLVVSAVPNFEKRTITCMFSNTDFLRERFANFSYYDEKKWPDYASVFSVLLPVVNELESIGDSCYNLMILAQRRYDKKMDLPEEAIKNIANNLKLNVFIIQEFNEMNK